MKFIRITGIRDCMKKMYINEGFTAFWKGILPPIIMETPKRAVKVGDLYIICKNDFACVILN